MVKLELNLPWSPILAWPWGVKYIIDPETFLVTKHIESWDIGAWDVSDCVVISTRRPYITSNRSTHCTSLGRTANIPPSYSQN